MAYNTTNVEIGYREDALKNLRKIKATRAGKKYKMVRINAKTWKEVEV
jgi:hypothetical protein